MSTCTNVKFATEAYALAHIKRKQETAKEKPAIPARAYLCPHCNSWHITSQKSKQVLHLENRIENLLTEIESLKSRHAAEIESLKADHNTKLHNLQEIANNRKTKIDNQKILLSQQYELIKKLRSRIGYL